VTNCGLVGEISYTLQKCLFGSFFEALSFCSCLQLSYLKYLRGLRSLNRENFLSVVLNYFQMHPVDKFSITFINTEIPSSYRSIETSCRSTRRRGSCWSASSISRCSSCIAKGSSSVSWGSFVCWGRFLVIGSKSRGVILRRNRIKSLRST